MMKKCIPLIGILLVLSAWTQPCLAMPVAVIPDATYRFETVPEGTAVVHEYVVQNAGDSDLIIEEVQVD